MPGKRIVIIGAGSGGIVLANALRHKLDSKARNTCTQLCGNSAAVVWPSWSRPRRTSAPVLPQKDQCSFATFSNRGASSAQSVC